MKYLYGFMLFLMLVTIPWQQEFLMNALGYSKGIWVHTVSCAGFGGVIGWLLMHEIIKDYQ